MADRGANEFKITVLGSGGVGKSALTIRLITGEYEANYDPTIEDSYRKQTTVDGEPALMDILDTAGQEEYAALQDQWIREGDGFILVYAINNSISFEEVDATRQKIFRILDEDPDKALVPIVLAGNKCDLPDDDREVTLEQGEKKKVEWKCGFYECSAKEQKNIEELFHECVRQIRKIRGDGDTKDDKKGGKTKKGGMCTLL